MVNVFQDEVIKFIQYQVMYRFGNSKTIPTHQGTMFTKDRVVAFAQQFGIKLMHSTPILLKLMGKKRPPIRLSLT